MGTSYRTPIVVAQLTYTGLAQVRDSTFVSTVSKFYMRSPWMINGKPVDHYVMVVGFSQERQFGQVDVHFNVAASVSSSQEAAFEAMIQRVFADFANVVEELCERFTMSVNISYLVKSLNFYSRN